jgi:glycosyltransferase involved in cell wall biosynthesis
LLGLSPGGRSLVDRLGLLDCDLVVLMPVRVTRAKNIEYALQVTAALKARGCRSKLVVTGPPDPHAVDSLDYFHSLQELRRRLKVEDEVRFVYESGADPAEPLLIDQRVVGDLFRVSDVMFMPSHREGFGMPILESGLTGLLVASTDVPAAKEIGGEDVLQFDSRDDPAWVQDSPAYRLRRRVRQSYTWPAIFRRDIEPLLNTVQT